MCRVDHSKLKIVHSIFPEVKHTNELKTTLIFLLKMFLACNRVACNEMERLVKF